MLRQLSRRLGQARWTADSERTVCQQHHHYHYNWQQRRCLSQHIDLDAFKANSRRIISQTKSPEPQINLYKALTGFIPPAINNNNNNNYGDSDIEQSDGLIIAGFHFVYCNEMMPPSHLLPDGTDDLHCPSPHGDFMFRLWAGGDISFARHRHKQTMKKPTTAVTRSSSTLCLGEQVVDAKMVDGGNKAFVKVRRTLVECPFSSINDDDRIRTIALDMDAAKKLNPIDHHASGYDDHDDDIRLHLVENRWLYFTRTRPAMTENNEAEIETKLPTCPTSNGSNNNNSKVDFHWLVTPDAALLFRFSALTLNTHAIHLDREYTRRVYGLPDLVVHGPLTVCLMMQVLLCAQRRYESACGLGPGRRLVIDSLSYTNIAPLYVDQTMKICVKEPESPSPPEEEEEATTGSQVWQVWISKKVNGVWRVAVRANAKVATNI